MSRLYDSPLPSTRTGPLYNAFSYPTKIDAESVAVFLAAHTQPGDTVLDVFAGSGSTGIAARLCDAPTPRMRELASAAGVDPRWGPRKAILYELSPVAALLGRVMCDPPDPGEFGAAAAGVIDDVEREFGHAYAAVAPDGSAGRIRHVVWTDVLVPGCCGRRVTLWDAVVRRDPASIRDSFVCAGCGERVAVADAPRALLTVTDPVTGRSGVQRERVMAQVYGRSASGTWSRRPIADDFRVLDQIARSPLPWVPQQEFVRGDLYRSGYHVGLDYVHQIYTPRNLHATARLWKRVEDEPEALRDALRLLLLSYNTTHSTLLTRVVAKKGQRDLVLTGAQTGVLYVSGLPVEKNVLTGIRRKVRTFRDAFELTAGSRSVVNVRCGSSTRLDLPDESVDYVFTDPPFGGFIPYSEINQINEAWLGSRTNTADEAIISPAQGKGLEEYAGLLRQVFAEVSRVTRRSAPVTVIFHASKPAVWRAVSDAFSDNGFSVVRTSVLDKRQVSFKQVVSAGSTRGDAVFLLAKSQMPARTTPPGVTFDEVVARLLAAATSETERQPRRLYSRYVASCVERGAPVEVTAPGFYALLDQAAGSST